eukprot:364076-Chlamydomonas_euryale.AAC.8
MRQDEMPGIVSYPHSSQQRTGCAAEASAGGRNVEEASSMLTRRVLRSLLLAHETVAAWSQEPAVGKGVVLIRVPLTEPSAVGCIPKPFLHLNGKRRASQVMFTAWTSLLCALGWLQIKAQSKSAGTRPASQSSPSKKCDSQVFKCDDGWCQSDDRPVLDSAVRTCAAA